ncbi:hypothetical protein E5332_03170 [Enterorhabdus sp. NM05_H27]|nr:hypothetical protein E5332_03170 [Enterorhabdus sp. NM05_H27]
MHDGPRRLRLRRRWRRWRRGRRHAGGPGRFGAGGRGRRGHYGGPGLHGPGLGGPLCLSRRLRRNRQRLLHRRFGGGRRLRGGVGPKR